MIEVSAMIGLAAVGALWKIAVEHGSMREGMKSILKELQLLRSDLTSDIRELESDLLDHEVRIRELEKPADRP
ncbi:MAG: hypothetical protein RI906_2303 [Pseudomonadota bacterium]